MGQGRRKPLIPISLLILATLFLRLLLSSCSVLEDRTGCPCRLHLLLICPESAAPVESLSLLLSASSWEEIRSLALPPAGIIEMTVPKKKEGVALLAVVGPETSGSLSACGFEIPLGTDCPSGLLLGAAHVDTDREEASCLLELQRHPCASSSSRSRCSCGWCRSAPRCEPF